MNKPMRPDNAGFYAACGISGRNRQQRRQQESALRGGPPVLQVTDRISWRRVKKAIFKFSNGLPCTAREHCIACDWLGVG